MLSSHKMSFLTAQEKNEKNHVGDRDKKKTMMNKLKHIYE